MEKVLFLLFLCSSTMVLSAQNKDYPFLNSDLTIENRVNDRISRLTLSEKVQLMKHESPAISRLGIPAYDWWNEALHGVARTQEKVTVYPIGLLMSIFSEIHAGEEDRKPMVKILI